MRFIALLLGSVLVAVAMAPAAAATVLQVTRLDDPRPGLCSQRSCSLREAVLAANQLSGDVEIRLGAGIHVLQRLGPTANAQHSGPLHIQRSMRIVGQGIGRTTVRWAGGLPQHEHALFYLENAPAPPIHFDLESFTATHGRGLNGGCLRSARTLGPGRHELTLLRMRFTECEANIGGALTLLNTDLTATHSEFLGNRAHFRGGALNMMGPNVVVTFATRWIGNEAGLAGGAVSIFGSGPVGWVSNVVWRDGGLTSLRDNVAGDQGGAIAFEGTGSLDLASEDGVSPWRWLEIRNNSAARGGGIDLSQGIVLVSSVNRIARVRLLNNTAERGGGLASSVSLVMSDSHVSGNRAEAGNGGGLLLTGSIEWGGGRQLARIGLDGNVASGGGGGAIHSECASLQASDLSFYGNLAALARAQALEAEGPVFGRHLTLQQTGFGPVLGRTSFQSCASGAVELANSIVDGLCLSAVPGDLVSLGGNVLTSAAAGCPVLAGQDLTMIAPSALSLQQAHWASPFPVLGWHFAQTPPQQGQGLADHCTETDIRGEPRDPSACDAGAFER